MIELSIDEEEVIAEIDFAKDEVKGMVVIADEETVNYEGDGVVVYAQSFVKGNFMTAFAVDGEFDLSELQLQLTRWNDLLLVTGFNYHGIDLDHDGWQDDS